MKVKAFILLLTLAVYFLDIMAAVNACRMSTNPSCITKEINPKCRKEIKPECSMKGKSQQCNITKTKSRNKETKSCCPKNSSKTKDCTKECLDCPQCYITTISPDISLAMVPLI